MSLNEVVKDGAVFVSDAHVREGRDDFLTLLKKIKSKEIKTSQLFLMGDIFDLLVGGVKYTVIYNKKYIELLNELSKEIEIFYFEGNHDFNLSSLFPNIKIFPIESQPVVFKYQNRNILLSHGDVISPFLYKLYTKIIRNKFFLFMVAIVDRACFNAISKKIIDSQKDKNLCHKIKNFKNMIKNRIKKVDISSIDFIVEGHFHQGMEFECLDKRYINLPCFACDKSFFIVRSQTGFKSFRL
ncbi:MAG: UDP-2,3-diacylglucosamine diphosphatase [Epsilonproteobacteria bacterium]|nr:UDP-2,3-diacylglucosamine diphosphatase [Campylobacterota bacterium]